MVNVNVDVQHSGVVLQQLKYAQHAVVDVAEAWKGEQNGEEELRKKGGGRKRGRGWGGRMSEGGGGRERGRFEGRRSRLREGEKTREGVWEA